MAASFRSPLVKGPWDLTIGHDGGKEFIFVTNVLVGNVTQGPPHVVNKGTVVRFEVRRPKGFDLVRPKLGGGGGFESAHAGHRGEELPMDFVTPMGRKHCPRLCSATVIGSGFSEIADPVALVIGPTGLGLNGDILYVADSVNNRIAAIPRAFERKDTAHAGDDVTSNGLLSDPLGLLFDCRNRTIVSANGGDSNLVVTSPSGTQLGAFNTSAGAGGLFGIALSLDGHSIYFVNDNNNTLNLLTGV